MNYGCRCNCSNFREHIGNGPAIHSNALPNRGSRRTKDINATDKQWEVDGAAYSRLRKEGHQPQQIDGCAELEKKASHPIEIEHGQVYGKKADYANEVQTAIRESV